MLPKVLKFAKRLAKNNYDLQFEQLILTNWLTLDYCSLSVAHLKSEMHQVSYSTYFFAAPRIRFVHSLLRSSYFSSAFANTGPQHHFPQWDLHLLKLYFITMCIALHYLGPFSPFHPPRILEYSKSSPAPSIAVTAGID